MGGREGEDIINAHDRDPSDSLAHEDKDIAVENSRLRSRIAELETHEEQWRQTEESYRKLDDRLTYSLEGAGLGVWELDLLTGAAWRSLRYDMIFGYESLLPEWTYDMFLEHVHPEDRGEVDRKYRHAVAASAIWEFECRIRRVDGTQRWIWAQGKTVCNERNEPVKIYGMVRDITKSKEVEKELEDHREHLEELVKERTTQLKESHQKLKALMKALPVGVAMCDIDGRNIINNEAFDAIWGAPRPEVTGLDDYMQYKAYWADTGMPVQQEEWASIQATLKGETVKGQIIEIESFNGARRFVHNSASPIRDNEGSITGTAVAIQDITDLRQAEQALKKALEELDEKARELQRSNKELELFAYTASHDLREPLRKFTVFSDRLRIHSGPKLDEKGLDYLARMDKAAHRMTQLIDGLLELSRVTTRAVSYSNVNLSEVIEEVQSDMEVRLKETGAEIVAGPMPVLEADPLNMRQLFQNLISNALKFCTAPPRIVIRCRPVDHLHEITIQDNGIGFEEKYLDLIFKPFQQLHERGASEGIGMGLAICQRIVSRHHGTITAKSMPGEGSVFIITLPVRQGGA